MIKKEINIKLIKNNNVNSYFKMKIIMMIVKSIIMMMIGVVMIVVFGDLDVVCKFCICFVLNINEKLY